jgi:hypothetical protein
MATRRRVASIRSGGAKIKVPAPAGNRFWVVKTVASQSAEWTVLNGPRAVKEISIPTSGNPTMVCASVRPTNQHFKVQLPSCRIFSKPHIYVHTGPIIQSFLGAYAKLWEATISFVTSVRPHWTKRQTTKRIITKSDIWGFFENLSRKLSFVKIWPQ